MSNIRNLIEAVEAGTLPEAVFHGCSVIRGHWAYTTGLDALQRQKVYLAYNGSLDAAEALHEALLPGWMPQIIKTYDDSWMVNIKERGKQYMQDSTFAPTPARAWLLAILRAVEAKG